MKTLNEFINRRFKQRAKQNKISTNARKSNAINLILNKISKRPQPATKTNKITASTSSSPSNTTTIITNKSINKASPSSIISINLTKSSKNILLTPTSDQLVVDDSSNNLVFKKRVTFSTESYNRSSSNSSLITKLNKLGNDSITLYQMYNDNNTFNEFNLYSEISGSVDNITNSSGSSYDSSDNGFESDFTGSKLSIDQTSTSKTIKSILSNRSSNNSSIMTDGSDNLFDENVSILKLDHQIRIRLSALKLSATKLNIMVPSNVCMLETVYDMKMDALRIEARAVLKKFDRKIIEQAERTNLNKIITSTAKLFKKSYRRRSKSAEANKSSDKHTGLDNSFGKQQHKNYYSFERDALEKKYENQMRAIQLDVLNALNGIELQFQQIKSQKEEMDKIASSNNHRHYCNRHKRCHRHHHHRSRTNHQEHDLNKSRVVYSGEASMQKRINKRKEHRDRSTNLNSIVLRERSHEASRLSSGSSFNLSLNSSDLQSKKYRNPYVTETMV